VNTLQTVMAVTIAAGIPAIFLVLIYTLDLYASRTFRLALVSFGWGAIGAFGLAFGLNRTLAPPLARLTGLPHDLLLVVFLAPVIEEIAKSLSLFYIARQPDFTYFVDGAIYGFASGIGFSIIENFLYLNQHPSMGVPLALTRAFSTCLMHGTAAAFVGTAIGRFRFKRRSGRQLALVVGWVLAIALHMAFNFVAWLSSAGQGWGVIAAVAIGLSGVGLIVFFIFRGLTEEREWLAETLDRKLGVTSAEVKAAQAYADIEEIMRPIAKQFPQQAEQVESMLLIQARMGIKQKVKNLTDDPKLQKILDQEIAEMHEEMDRLRKQVGLGVMAYLRCVFPETASDLWDHLERVTVCSAPSDIQRWIDMLEQEEGAENLPPKRDIFSAMSEQSLREAEGRQEKT